MAEKFKRRKRNYLINKDLQGKLGLKYLLLTLFGSLMLGLFLAAASSDHLTISYDNNAIKVGNTPMVLAGEILRSGALFVLLGGILIIIITIVLTHKIAGPLYRFEMTLEAMCARKLDQRIYLRKGDEGKKLGQLINDFNLELSADISQLKAAADRLEESEQKSKILEIVDKYQLPEKTE